ncbi:glycosyltransferase family 2 protein [bacterium]|nr:glycosyltransferase family 2 protein [bacterium]
MKNLVLAISTFNRKDYLASCIESYVATRNNNYQWTLVIADDCSTDQTHEYLNELMIDNTKIVILKNERIGVHQQMNTILNHLETINYDFCFKADDDITFLKSGWDDLYFKTALVTGNHHLVFCDENWCIEQLLETKVLSNNLVGNVPTLHAHGFFYTLSPQVTDKVGFMDVNSFGFRGMGHVDYTMRCARAGYTNKDTPWDIIDSNNYISATKHNYKSVLPSISTSAYDEYNRAQKETIILKKNRIYVPFQNTNTNIYKEFKNQVIEALSDKVLNFDKEKKELVTWYEEEISKIKKWYTNKYDFLPNWYIVLGKIFKLFR